MKYSYKLLVIVCCIYFSFLESKQANSQCCAAGNPVCDIKSDKTSSNSFDVGLAYRYSYSDTYYERNKKSELSYKTTSYDFILSSITYGVTSKLSAKGELGYFINKAESFEASGYKRYTSGLGDASLSLKYLAIANPIKKYSVAAFMTFKLPIGEFDQEYKNVLLPIDLQPSSGSNRYKPGVQFIKSLNNKRMSLFSSFAAEFAQPIKSERTKNYKYGNLYLFNITGIYRMTQQLDMLIGLRNQYREKASNEGNIIHASGGEVLFLIPQLTYKKNGWRFSTMLDAPIYKDLNDLGYPQLSNKYAFTFAINKSINLEKKDRN